MRRPLPAGGPDPKYAKLRLEVWDDDGSKEWADLFERLQSGPIREQRNAG